MNAGLPLRGDSRAVRPIEQQYEAAVETWRSNLMRYLLGGQEAKFSETADGMRRFTYVTTAFLDLKRPGKTEILDLHYRNLENLSRLEELHLLVNGYRRDHPDHSKDFMSKYGIVGDDFRDFASFAVVYGKVMDAWRERMETALRKMDKAMLHALVIDIQLLRFAVSGFIFLPGKAASSVPQLQVMENDLRHAAFLLRLHGEALAALPDPVLPPGNREGAVVKDPVRTTDSGPKWTVVVKDPPPGSEIPMPENVLARAVWWPATDPFDSSVSLSSGFGQPGNARRLEWTMLYILLSRLSGTEPGNGISGIVVGQDGDYRVIGYYEDVREDSDGNVLGRRKVFVDRVISGLELAREDFIAFCRWRYGSAPW
jgi:hypothetical protein